MPGTGPDGIDPRPEPSEAAPEPVLPLEVAGYRRGPAQPVDVFMGMSRSPGAVCATCTGTGGRVRVLAATRGSTNQGAETAAAFVRGLDELGVLGSRRLAAHQPYVGW